MKIKKILKELKEIHVVDADTLEEIEDVWRDKYMGDWSDPKPDDWEIVRPVHVYSGFLGLGWVRYRLIVERSPHKILVTGTGTKK